MLQSLSRHLEKCCVFISISPLGFRSRKARRNILISADTSKFSPRTTTLEEWRRAGLIGKGEGGRKGQVGEINEEEVEKIFPNLVVVNFDKALYKLRKPSLVDLKHIFRFQTFQPSCFFYISPHLLHLVFGITFHFRH